MPSEGAKIHCCARGRARSGKLTRGGAGPRPGRSGTCRWTDELQVYAQGSVPSVAPSSGRWPPSPPVWEKEGLGWSRCYNYFAPTALGNICAGVVVGRRCRWLSSIRPRSKRRRAAALLDAGARRHIPGAGGAFGCARASHVAGSPKASVNGCSRGQLALRQINSGAACWAMLLRPGTGALRMVV